jgi:GDP-4-dehydro-6-deoxy-D-mannose reductase
MKKVLITGASGFVGGFLAEYLISFRNYEIYGTYTSDSSLERSPVKDKITFIKANFQDAEQVQAVVQAVKPDYLYHLVAQASVSASFTDPIGTFHANIDSEVHLFEALKNENLYDTRVLVVCSAEEYGYVTAEDLPVDEHTPLRPASPYAVSKIAQDYLASQYHLSYELPLIRVRPYNHIGPRQKAGYVSSDFARQVAMIENDKQEPIIHVGNLEARRDFTDVRDMVRAYVELLEKGVPGEVYNIGSGVSHSAQEIVDILLRNAKREIEITVDLDKLRPSDVPEIVVDATKMKKIIQWEPEISFEQTVKDILDYWRSVE